VPHAARDGNQTGAVGRGLGRRIGHLQRQQKRRMPGGEEVQPAGCGSALLRRLAGRRLRRVEPRGSVEHLRRRQRPRRFRPHRDPPRLRRRL
ncbi:MAG: hypothetical protein AVDCRST_MAG08-2709, partial [uncultured Acetobacteraceae bacterium]